MDLGRLWPAVLTWAALWQVPRRLRYCRKPLAGPPNGRIISPHWLSFACRTASSRIGAFPSRSWRRSSCPPLAVAFLTIDEPIKSNPRSVFVSDMKFLGETEKRRRPLIFYHRVR